MHAGIGASVAALALSVTAAIAQPLSIIKVEGHTIDCLFSSRCTIAPDDHFTDIPLPGIDRKAILMSRTFVGGPDSHAHGITAYQYRIDLKTTVALADSACVTNITLDFGAVAKVHYDASLPPGDVYIIAKGVPQNQVGLESAVKSGSDITFTFERPVCTSPDGLNGDVTFFFGLAAHAGPRGTRALVDVPGLNDIVVKATAPIHQP
jgi:hypothetical protein